MTHGTFSTIDEVINNFNLVGGMSLSFDDSSKFDTCHFDINAINVDKVTDIPENYDGVMGVPITFLDKYCPKQFMIVEGSNRYGILDYWGKNEEIRKNHSHGNNINGVATYFRIHIRHIS